MSGGNSGESRFFEIGIDLDFARLSRGIYFYHQKNVPPPQAVVEARDSRWLVPVAVEEIGAIEIILEGKSHRFERDKQGAWFFHQQHADNPQLNVHNADAKQVETITMAFNMLTRAQREQKIPYEDKCNSLGGNTAHPRHNGPEAAKPVCINPSADEYGVGMPGVLVIGYRPNELQCGLQSRFWQSHARQLQPLCAAIWIKHYLYRA